ncbi:hypothetical protein [Corynebacterium sputi]|nr:hypothetical protein [Corynebacterium sputi]
MLYAHFPRRSWASGPVSISLVRVDVGVEPPEEALGEAGDVFGER